MKAGQRLTRSVVNRNVWGAGRQECLAEAYLSLLRVAMEIAFSVGEPQFLLSTDGHGH